MKNPTCRWMTLCIAALLAAPGCSPGTAPGPPELPQSAIETITPEWPEGAGNGANLLLISVDTLRADHLGTYGYVPPTSPTIDALAEGGVVFEQAFAPRGLTWPSLGSLMTARYPVQHGVRTNGARMPASEMTLAEILREKGYASAAFISENVIDQEWEGFAEVSLKDDPNIARSGITWLEQQREAPFFLWLHFFGPHKPYTPPAAYAERFSPNYSGVFDGTTEHLNAITLHQKKLDQADLDHLIGLYDALIARTDDLVEQVLETLDSLGVRDNTLVVFTSDHGEDLYEYNRHFYHLASVYDSSLHVPLIFNLPAGIPGGVRAGPLVEVTDIAPTILELLGFEAAPSFAGRSLVPLFTGSKTFKLEPTIAEWQDRMLSIRTETHRYVLNPTNLDPPWIPLSEISHLEREDFYKEFLATKVLDENVIEYFYPIDEVELYDVTQKPPVRLKDLDEHADTTAELNRLIQAWQDKYGWQWMGGIDDSIDPDVQERLEGLGYVF